MARIRIDKYLADTGFGTRKTVKELLKKKQVTVNTRICTNADEKIDTEVDCVAVQGVEACYEAYSYYMLNKPQGVVSATRDKQEKTVVELIREPKRRDLFPVGRLDKDTEGLLLLTNDGKLANELLAPGKHVPKTYYARIDAVVTPELAEVFETGVDIGDETKTAPAKLRIIKSGAVSEIELCITEGRYHQVKRMFEAVGMHVIFLKRLSMGPLQLDDSLACGEYRKLTKAEITLLKDREQW